MNRRLVRAGLLAVTLAVPMVVWAEHVPEDEVVQFGQYQFPQDAAPFNWFLSPAEVTIVRGGTVTFEFNGNGHGIAIYPVASTTTREDIETDLCQPDPATCFAQNAANAALQYFVRDSREHLVIDTDTNPPSNRVNDPVDRLVYGGGPVFFTGRAAADAPAPVVQYKFDKVGRYLVVCTDRPHFINGRMFGFVNVVKKRHKDVE